MFWTFVARPKQLETISRRWRTTHTRTRTRRIAHTHKIAHTQRPRNWAEEPRNRAEEPGPEPRKRAKELQAKQSQSNAIILAKGLNTFGDLHGEKSDLEMYVYCIFTAFALSWAELELSLG